LINFDNLIYLSEVSLLFNLRRFNITLLIFLIVTVLSDIVV